MTNDTGAWFVVGADGGIGSRLFAALTAAGLPVLGTTRRPANVGGAVSLLDLASPGTDWPLPARVSVAYLCAAVTSIDQCRRDPAGTRLVNVDRTVALARQFRDRGAFVVFLSTNQVFDGTRPHRPADDPVCPQTEYGRQKAAAEREILNLGGAVVRLTKVFTAPPPLLDQWAAALRAGDPVAPFADMVFSPVGPGAVTEALAAVGRRRAPGIVQVSGERDVSYADVAGWLADRVGADPALVRPAGVAAKGIPPEAAPRHTTLDTDRLVREFGITLPPVRATVETLLARAARAETEIPGRAA